MKVILESKHYLADKSRQHQRLVETQCLLDRHEDVQKRRYLKALAEIIIFPESYLCTLPAVFLASFIVKLYRFLEPRKEHIVLRTLPLLNGDQHLLMISAPAAPYLVETLQILQQKYSDRFTLIAHPVLTVKRRHNEIINLYHEVEEGYSELLILVRLENIDALVLQRIQEQSRLLLDQALRVHQAAPLFREKLQVIEASACLRAYRPLVQWLQHNVFIPLWYRSFPEKGAAPAVITGDGGVGIDLSACLTIFNADASQEMNQELERLLARETTAVIHKLSFDSPLFGQDDLVYIGFRDKLPGAAVEHAFIGVFRNIELTCASCHVAELQQKTDETLARIRIPKGSHDHIKLQEIFSLFPKLELFFMGEAQLQLLAQSLIHYLSRPNSLKLLFLSSPSPFCISILIVIPQEFLTGSLKDQLTSILCSALQSQPEAVRFSHFGESFAALFLSLTPHQEQVRIHIDNLEKLLNRRCRPWSIQFRELLERARGKVAGSDLWRKYHDSFSAEYRAMFPPRYALKDLLQIEKLISSGAQGIHLLSPCHDQEYFRLHFYSRREEFLDEYLPILANLNLRLIDQVQFAVTVDETSLFIKSFAIMPSSAQSKTLQTIKPLLLEMITAIQEQRVENDALNKLLLITGMSWQEIDVLRTYRNYCLQLGFHSTVLSFQRALLNNPQLARSLFEYFEVRFRPSPEWDDPVVREEQGLFPIRLSLLENMETVSDLNDDRILRTLFNLIDSTVRSNFHVRKHCNDYFIAIKINSLGVIEMPLPRPSFEIYVHAADMEGIHLRGGKIARGGIRWSDRPDDFRTEILDLMQTQISKNALIVPTGAKGGFVVKLRKSHDNFREAGKKAYQRLMRGLLDLTDNYVNEQVISLPGIVLYDDSDPYLVVAADKGTAQFPDIANAIASEYGFWLGDAFASGGSHGYNHKVLGITARGAWESVKRHFRELGKNIQCQPFTVVGIGSMDGDVFGNGMLLSRCIQLRAAISGQHIFLDPAPDPDISYRERERLFNLPGSSWGDYQPDLISQGGGVYLRSSKDIPVSEPVRQWLGIRYRTLDGETLIRYLLCAKVELLWLGGIGTYVKAASEKHEEVGDRQNDNVRVDAIDMQAQVIGEGANLGVTRLARVEFALAGGLINADAIDNSAGVDTSDHEVNLKILLRALNKQQLVDDYQALFDELAEPVCEAVLANNYAQTLCLSLEQLRCRKDPEPYLELAYRLQAAGMLDFSVEAFPSAKTVHARDKVKLTRPELAVLIASAKRWLTQQLLDQRDLISMECCDYYLRGYFPAVLTEQFTEQIPSHPLASAIKATCISNTVINQAGCSFIAGAIENPTQQINDLIGSYLAFDRILGGDAFRKSLFELDNQIESQYQYSLLLEFETCLADFSFWSVANHVPIKPELPVIANYRHQLDNFAQYCAQHAQPEKTEPARDEANLSEDVKKRLQLISRLKDFPAAVALVVETNSDIDKVTNLFAATAVLLHFDPVLDQLGGISLVDSWERKLFAELKLGLKQRQFDVVKKVLQSGDSSAQVYFADPQRQSPFNRYQRTYHEIAGTSHHNLMPYLVWYKALEKLLETI